MNKFFVPEVEATADWSGYQDELVRTTVTYGWEHSPEIRQRLEQAGVRPTDIRGTADLARVPVLSKDDLPELQAATPPFGNMLAVPREQLGGIYLSPGPILDPQGGAPDFWRVAPALWAAGFRSGHVVQNTFSYHLTPAGAMLEGGLRAIGCVVVAGGVGNTESQVDLMARVEVSGYVGTPDFLLTLVEHARDRGVSLGVRRAWLTGGPLAPSLRQELQDEYEIDVYQGYGTADAGTLGYECEAKDGWHVAPSVVVEITEPATGEPVTAEKSGEVVVTSPNEVYPLVRFGTGDLSAWNTNPCSCGRTSPRMVGFLGRVGDGVKVRGMFLHPRQLVQVLANDPAVARYQAVVSQHDHRDTLTIRMEAQAGAEVDIDHLTEALRAALKLRADVELVDPGTIPEDAPPLIDARSLE
ncbi:MAG: AMP-binding protein [Gemmatimonadales bacterium]